MNISIPALVCLVLGLVIYFIPSGGQPAPAPATQYGNKVQSVAFVMIFWGAYFLLGSMKG